MTTLQIISICLSLVSLVAAAANIVFISKAEKELDKAIKTQIEIGKMTANETTHDRASGQGNEAKTAQMGEKQGSEEEMNIDEAAHKIFDFRAQKYSEYEYGRFKVAYHEDRLYSVRDTQRNTVTLVTERNPMTAYCKAVSLPVIEPKWVPINERKPTEGREYIVRFVNGERCIMQFDESADEFGDWEPVFDSSTGGWEGADFHRAEGITHWLDFAIPVLETPEILPF